MDNSAVPKYISERALGVADNTYRTQDIDLKTIENYCKEENLLGVGGFGAVYRGQHNGQDVAIKRIEQDKTKYNSEIEKNFNIMHPNVTSMITYVKDLEFQQKYRYLVILFWPLKINIT